MKLIRYQYPQSTANSTFDRLFNLGVPSVERFGSLFDEFLSSNSGIRQPVFDLYEDDEAYVARFELPGVKKEEVDVEIENSLLTIRSSKTEQEDKASAQRSFQRVVSVPEGIDAQQVSAKMEDGILTVTLPKQETRKPLQISVN